MINIHPLPDHVTCESLQIPTSDNKMVGGELDKTKPNNDRLVIYTHGFRASASDFQAYLSRFFFVGEGYDFLRFNFYGYADNQRKLHECDLATHISDYEAVIDHIKKDYTSIFVIGHSLGALIAMMANADAVSATSLWDGTYPPAIALADSLDPSMSLNNDLQVISGRFHSLISSKFVNSIDDIDAEKARHVAQALNCPAQLVTAGQSCYETAHKNWFADFPDNASHVLLPEADHNFTGNQIFEAISLTNNWFNQLLS